MAPVRDGGGPAQGCGSDQSAFLKAELIGLADIWMWGVRKSEDQRMTAKFLVWAMSCGRQKRIEFGEKTTSCGSDKLSVKVEGLTRWGQ